jgi:hypothetical protein
VVAVGLIQRSFALRLQLIVGCRHLFLQSGRLVLEESSGGSEEWESVSPSLVNRTTRVRKTTSVSYQMSLIRPSSERLFQETQGSTWAGIFQSSNRLKALCVSLSELESMGVVPSRALFRLPPLLHPPPTLERQFQQRYRPQP